MYDTRPAALLPFPLLMPLVPASQTADGDWLAKGVRGYIAGDYAEAARCFGQALAEGAAGPALWLNLGLSHFQLANHVEAARAFKQLQGHDGWQAYGSYYQGWVAEACGRNNEALRRYRQAAGFAYQPSLLKSALERLTALGGAPVRVPRAEPLSGAA